MRKLKKGCVHIYTGDGKGKTTASIGLALRAASSGLRVCMFQFLKAPGSSSDNWLDFPNFRIVCLDQAHPLFEGVRGKGPGYKRKLTDKIKNEIIKIKRVMKSKKYDMIILDEMVNCVSEGFIDEKEVIGLVRARPKAIELVMTGRGATEALVKEADYVTRLDKVKHPFDRGLGSRKGIEY
jgi:cob(I)alamin adenosyltransferase